jgi:hypothetical protein
MRIRERRRLLMKRFNVIKFVVLILVLFISVPSQEQNKTAETADDLLLKFIENLEKKMKELI